MLYALVPLLRASWNSLSAQNASNMVLQQLQLEQQPFSDRFSCCNVWTGGVRHQLMQGGRGVADLLRQCYHSRITRARLCTIMPSAGPGGEEVPPVLIDRSGVKLAVQEQYSRNSKGTFGLVLEQVPCPTHLFTPCRLCVTAQAETFPWQCP